MTQKQRLLEWLQETGPINPLLAWRRLGIYRLSDTIFRLRKDGWNIATNTINIKNRFDETCHVAEYILKEDSWNIATNTINIKNRFDETCHVAELSEIAETIQKNNPDSFINSPEPKETEQMDLGL